MTYSATEYNLTDLLQDAYRELGQLNISTATGGSGTTVIDTKVKDKIGGDEAWLDGVIFIILDGATAGTDPEGKFAIITAWAEATGTFTFADMTGSVASGDTYGYVNDMYPLYQMIELANDALRALGDIPLIDITTLDTAAQKTEYAYAIAWKRRPPVKVEIQTKLSDADDFKWKEIHGWHYRPATAGSTGLLVLPQLTASRDLAIWYMDRHPRVNAYGDAILKAIHPELAKRALVEKALQWQNRRMMGGDDFLLQTWNDAKMQLMEAKLIYPIWKPKRKSRILTIGRAAAIDKFKMPWE